MAKLLMDSLVMSRCSSEVINAFAYWEIIFETIFRSFDSYKFNKMS